MPLDFTPQRLIDWVQIAFWIAAGLVAVLSYLQARKTFFQPLKLEVFKLQMALLARVHELCVGPERGGTVQAFDLDRIGSVNAYLALADYARTQFGEEGSAALEALNPGSLKDFEVQRAVAISAGASSIEIQILVIEKYRRALAELRSLDRDLLLPTRLRELLDALLSATMAYVSQYMATPTASRQRLAELYPTLESLQAIDRVSLWKTRLQGLVSVQNAGEQIVGYVREYYEVDHIKPQRRRVARRTSHDRWPAAKQPT